MYFTDFPCVLSALTFAIKPIVRNVKRNSKIHTNDLKFYFLLL